MAEKCFGSIRFIPGKNSGKYPHCNSIYIETAGVLIDPSSDRERLKQLRRESRVKAVWLSHWHEDHFMHLDLFEDLPLWIHARDAPMLSNLELFLDGYGIVNEEHRRYWREIMTTQFHFQPRRPAGFLPANGAIQLATTTVRLIATPGHTPGHLAFFFKQPAVLFMGDYDLTAFGPWYGDRESSIEDTVSSVKRLKDVDARVWLTAHGDGIFEENPADRWQRYLGVILQREAKLLELLTRPRTLNEIVEAWIVYGRPREPEGFFRFGEQALMQKHLDILINDGVVIKSGNRFKCCDDANPQRLAAQRAARWGLE